MSQFPPNGLMCQQCPYKQASERRSSASILKVAVDSASTNNLQAKIAAIAECMEAALPEGLTRKGHEQLCRELRQLSSVQ